MWSQCLTRIRILVAEVFEEVANVNAALNRILENGVPILPKSLAAKLDKPRSVVSKGPLSRFKTAPELNQKDTEECVEIARISQRPGDKVLEYKLLIGVFKWDIETKLLPKLLFFKEPDVSRWECFFMASKSTGTHSIL